MTLLKTLRCQLWLTLILRAILIFDVINRGHLICGKQLLTYGMLLSLKRHNLNKKDTVKQFTIFFSIYFKYMV